MAKRLYVKITTPPRTASWCHLNKPDTGGQYSDNKYKATMFLDQDDVYVTDVLAPAVQEAAKAEWPEGLPSNFHNPLDPLEDQENEEDNGKIKITFKSKDQPLLTDAAGTPLPPDVIIRSGDVIRVAGACAAYVSGKNKGVTFYLNAVRLIDKRSTGPDPFGDADEGYIADPDASTGNASTGNAPESSNGDDNRFDF